MSVAFRTARLTVLVLSLVGLGVLPGCRILGGSILPTGHLPKGIMPSEFTSPLPASYRSQQLSTAGMAQELGKRQKTPLRTAKGKFKFYAGTLTGMGTQSFDVLYGVDRPQQNLRLRASGNYGTLFDLLVENDRFEAVSFPEKVIMTGTTAALRKNPSLMAGLEPTMLFDTVAIQDTLLDRLKQQGQYKVKMRNFKDTYRLDVSQTGSSDSERFEVRHDDLLVSKYTRYRDNKLVPDRKLFSVNYLTYKADGAGAPIYPTAFTIGAKTGEIGVVVGECEVNGLMPPAIFKMENRPDGFKDVNLSEPKTGLFSRL